MDHVRSAKQLFTLEKQLYKNYYNPLCAAMLSAFMQGFVSNHNHYAGSVINFYGFGPPRQFWRTKINTAEKTNRRIEHIIDNQVKTTCNDVSLNENRKKELMRLDIAP